jgi:DNA-binding SARP family transcriptional activator
VEISVLGPVEVRRGGTAVPLGAPKLRALLLALVLDVGRVVHADRLIEQLWADEPPPQPLVSLRSYVSNLRRLLQEPDAPPVIATRAGGYVLDVPPERIDAVRFEELVRAGSAALAAGDAATAVDGLTSALALWRGEALADIATEAHARPTVTKLEELRLTALEERLDGLLQLGRHQDAVPELESLVASHPLRERPHRQLMLALYRCGRAPDALRVATDHRTALIEEFGLDPSPELGRLADRILRQEPTLDPSAPTPAHPSPAVETSSPAAEVTSAGTGSTRKATTPGSSSLVGRERERTELEGAVAALVAGRGTAVLIAGEPGIGKTALLQELERLARSSVIPVAWGRGLEQQGAPPFWPWLEVLRAVAGHLDDDTIRRALAGPGAPATSLVPELAERVGLTPTQPSGDPAVARFTLHDAVATFLVRAAEQRGLVVLLDDLHWADSASLELFAYLPGRLTPAGVLLAGSYRDAPTERTPELETAVATVVREPGAVTLELRPLPSAAVAAIVASVTGREPDEAMLADVQRRADGNPFFVRQLAVLLGDDTSRGRAAIPLGVRHVLVQRLHQVAEDVRRTLTAAAVLGQDFDVRQVASVTDTAVLDVLDHVDTAIRHGLVEVGAGHASAYRFVHALVRETLYDELGPGAAARLHAAAGTALEAIHPPAVEAIAEHLWRAGEAAPVDRTVRYLRVAADEAFNVLAYHRAEEQLRRALHLLTRSASDDASVELGVRLRLVQVLTGLYGWTVVEREEVSGRVRELVGLAGLGPELVPLWWSMWSTMMTRGDLTSSRELATELLAEAMRHDDPSSLVAGHVAVAYTDLFSGTPAERVLDRLAAASAAEREADPEALGRTPEHLGVGMRATIALCHALRDDEGATLAAGDEVVAHAQRVGQTFQRTYARLFAAWSAALVDRPQEAFAHAAAGLAVCERGGFAYLGLLTTPMHAWAAVRLGEDPHQHIDRLSRCLAQLESAGQFHAIGHWYGLLAELHTRAAAPEAARTALARAYEVAEQTGERVYEHELARIASLVRG